MSPKIVNPRLSFSKKNLGGEISFSLSPPPTPVRGGVRDRKIKISLPPLAPPSQREGGD